MSRRTRLLVFAPALALLAALVVWALVGLPGFGDRDSAYAQQTIKASVHQRHTANTVNGITYDIRGLDTLGEEFMLFVSAIGAAVLLRAQRKQQRSEEAADQADRRRPQTSSSLRALGAVLVGPALVLGLYIVAHGHVSPGGGFQGGVILAGALLLVYAAGQVLALKRVSPTALVEVGDAVGAGAFALMAVAGLATGAAALTNMLAPGELYQLMSSGTIALISGLVGIEVASAVTLVLTEFLDQTLLRVAGGGED